MSDISITPRPILLLTDCYIYLTFTVYVKTIFKLSPKKYVLLMEEPFVVRNFRVYANFGHLFELFCSETSPRVSSISVINIPRCLVILVSIKLYYHTSEKFVVHRKKTSSHGLIRTLYCK